MKKAKKITEKYVTEKTFESSMTNIAKSFARQNEISEMILKEIRQIHEDNKHFRENISGLNNEGLSYEKRIQNLTIRVERLELKSKI